MAQLKAVLFDVDFTLARPGPEIAACVAGAVSIDGGGWMRSFAILPSVLTLSFRFPTQKGHLSIRSSPGAQMKGDYIVHDKDVVEIHA